MSELVPKGWQCSTIHQTCEVLDSKRIPLNSQERALRKGNYAYYGANGVQGYIDDYIFEGEHVLLAEDGGYFDEWDSRPISYLVTGRFWVNNHAHILKAKKDNETRFVHYSLVHRNILKHINGGTRAKLNQSDMREIQFLRPPLPEQQKIAAILTSVDNVIEKTEAQINKLQDLKKGMMQELLTKGIGHSEFKDSPVGRIPKGWEVETLIDLSLNGVSNGVFRDPKKVGNGYKLINVYDMYQGFGVDIDSLELLELKRGEFERNKVEFGDIFFTRSSLKLEGIAYCNINFSKRDDLTFDGHLMRIRPNTKKVHPKFLAYYCLSDFSRRFFMSCAKHSTMTTIGQKDIAPLPVSIPTLEEQERIVNSLDSVEKLKLELIGKLEKSKGLKKSLMQDLLAGKVRVKINELEKEAVVD